MLLAAGAQVVHEIEHARQDLAEPGILPLELRTLVQSDEKRRLVSVDLLPVNTA